MVPKKVVRFLERRWNSRVFIEFLLEPFDFAANEEVEDVNVCGWTIAFFRNADGAYIVNPENKVVAIAKPMW